MQFLYADGSDAHFMDEQSFEQLAIPETSIADTLKWVKPNESVDLLFIDDEPSDVQLAASVELEVTHTEPGVRGRHRLGRRQQARHARDRRDGPGPAVRQHRRPRQGGHALGLVHVARVSGPPLGPAPGRGLRALPARAHGAPARRRLRARRRSRSRARSRTRRRTTRRSSTSSSPATPRAGRSTRIAPLEKAIMRVALLEMLHPDLVEGDRRSRPRARSARPCRPPRSSAAPRRRVRQRRPRRSPPRRAREWRAACLTRPRLDELVDAPGARGAASCARASSRRSAPPRSSTSAPGSPPRRARSSTAACAPADGGRRPAPAAARSSSREPPPLAGASYPDHLRDRGRGVPAALRFAARARRRRARGGDALLAAGGRQADPARARARHGRARSAAIRRGVLPLAAALELIHTYSLIHDDLPAMDDDDLRRGRPTCHVRYGEDVAILAGDGALRGGVPAGRCTSRRATPPRSSRAVAELADATGVERHGRRPVHRRPRRPTARTSSGACTSSRPGA